MTRWRVFRRALILLLIGWPAILALHIATRAHPSGEEQAEVAIVLGAAVQGERPSPVFEERIRHGVDLYRAGRVRVLLFTGGTRAEGVATEASVARRYALARGVPPEAILTEERSRTTVQNLAEARQVMAGRGLATAIVVSDPLHMRRALRICTGLDMACSGSPTPTSRYRSLSTRAYFLTREVFFYTVYLVTGA